MSQQLQGNSMRVLHVIHSLRRGGAEQSLDTLARRLTARGHDVHVLALWPPYDLAAGLRDAGVQVHEADVGNRWNLLAAISSVARVCNRVQPDLVHAHLRHAEFAVGFAPLRDRDVVRLATFHNLPPISTTGVPARLARAGRRFLHAHRFQGAIGVSDVVADRHRRLLDADPIEVVPNPVDVPTQGRGESTESSPDTDGIVPRDGTFTVLSPGRISHEKGHDVLVEALAHLVGGGFDVRVILVGGGPDAERIRRQARRLSLDQNLDVRGSVSHDRLLAAMREADLVAIPSRSEGFGLAAAEAMAVGSPLVATSVGGLREVVDDGRTGLLVPPEDPGALAETIADFVENPDRRRSIADQARTVIRERYAPKRITDRTEEVYRSLTS